MSEDRNILILEARISGRKIAGIADEFGISTTRVGQILSRFLVKARRYDLALAECGRLRAELSEVKREARVSKISDRSELDIPICELNLSVRSANCLRDGGFVSARQVATAKDWELYRVPNLGRKSLKEIRLAVGSIDD